MFRPKAIPCAIQLSAKRFDDTTALFHDGTWQTWNQPLMKYPMEYIAVWSYIEATLEQAVCAMAPNDVRLVRTIIDSLRGGRLSAVQQIVRSRMSPDDFKLYQFAYSYLRKLELRRHDFAHGLWGTAYPYRDDVLPWTSQESASQRHASFSEVLESIRRDPEGIETNYEMKAGRPRPCFYPEKRDVWMYDEEVLQANLVHIREACELTRILADFLDLLSSERSAPAREQLCSIFQGQPEP